MADDQYVCNTLFFRQIWIKYTVKILITPKKLARVEQASTLKREVTILFRLPRGFFSLQPKTG